MTPTGLSVTLNTAALPCGPQVARLTIAATGAAGSPRVVTITVQPTGGGACPSPSPSPSPSTSPSPSPVACVVTSADDGGAGTLREKVAAPSCGSITFALPGAAPWTIPLTSALPRLTRPLTVTGPSAGSLTITGDNRFASLFIVEPGGNLTVRDLTLAHAYNALYLDGGGSATVTRTTLIDNNWGIRLGGGGTATIANSTFTDNAQAALYLDQGGTATLTGSTLSDNGFASVAINIRGSATVTNTILAGTAGPNCSGPVANGGHNLDDDGTCGFGATNGSISGQPALLGPLTQNGGLTLTHALVAGSPAIDAGDPAVCAASPTGGTDQRGVARPQGSTCDIGAYEGSLAPQPCVVTSTDDTTTGATLRAALGQTGPFAATSCGTITFALPGPAPWTITLGSDLALVARPLTVTGPGAAQLTIAGGIAGGDRRHTIFLATTGAALAISDLTLAQAGHGVLLSQRASATVARVILRDNGHGVRLAASLRDNGHGGRLVEAGSATVTASTLSGNVAGIATRLGGTVAVSNSTLSGNDKGIHFDQGGTATVIGSTFNLNDVALTGSATVTNTIIAGSWTTNCTAPLTGGHNLDEDNSCGLGATGGNVSGLPALLGPLAPNAPGSTPTHALLAGSPARDAGDPAACAAAPVSGLDQRGVARSEGTGCDIGAYEGTVAQVACVVTSADDTTAGATLRAALGQTGDFVAAPCGTITFALPGTGPWTIPVTGDLPPIAWPLAITGPGASRLTIDGQNTLNLFIVTVIAGGDLTLAQLTLARGRIGLVIVRGGRAAVVSSALTGNDFGVGVSQHAATALTSTLTVTGSTLSGGCTICLAAGGSATVTNSTLSGSYQAVWFRGGGSATLTNSTLSGSPIGLFFDQGGDATVTNTIMMLSSSRPVVSGNCIFQGGGAFANGGHNLADDATCFANGASQSVVVGPGAVGLDPAGLQDNGGPTRTIDLVAGSPAIDAGDAAVCAAAPVGGVDQRGVARPVGARCDIGAVETSASPSPSPSPSPVACVVTSADDGGAGTLREKVAAPSCASITFALPGAGPWTITLASALATIARPLTITGPGAGQLTVAGVDRQLPVFRVGTGGLLTVSGLTVARASAGVQIEQGGRATVRDAILSGNAWGAILFDSGQITVSGSTLDGNDYGVLIDGGGGATLVNVTLSGNQTAVALGAAGSATLTNATLSNNNYGVYVSRGDDTLVALAAGVPTLTNTIVAGSRFGNCVGPIADGGHNLDDDGSCGFGGTNGSISGQPALLGPLARNAPGTTPTHALSVGSPAIDAGDAAACARTGAGEVNGTDQRGVARPQGPRCDIGAHERDVPAPTVTIDQAAGQADPTSAATITFTATFSAPVTGFDGVDLSFAGSTATGTLVAVVGGGPTVYTVSVTGMAGPGTVVATIAPGAALDTSGTASAASSSTDNAVTYAPLAGLGGVGGAGIYGGPVTLTATLSATPAVSGVTIAFTLDGAAVCGAALPACPVADGGGQVTLVVPAASLPAARRGAGGHAGAVCATATGGAPGAPVCGDLAVVPAPLTVTAADQTRPYGASDPPLTATHNGFVYDETIANAGLGGTLTCATTAVPTSAPGTYPITCAGQTAPNYTLTYIPGTLTVTRADQRIAFPQPPDATRGDASLTVTAAATSGLLVAFAATAGDPCTVGAGVLANGVSSAVVTLTGVGTCTLTGSQPGDSNYHAAPAVSRQFAIVAPPAPSPGTSPPASPSPSPTPSPPSPSASPSPTPAPGPAALVTLTLATIGLGGGTVGVSPPGVATGPVTRQFPRGTVVTLTPEPVAAGTFTGWALDGRPVGWASPATLTMDTDHALVATFAPALAFGDVPGGDPAAEAISQLAARGVINGCDKDALPPQFCPDDAIRRHEMAALTVRAMPGWADETWPHTFTDPTDDAELMRRVATLQHHGVVQGYQAEVCAAQGKTAPCFGPLDNVTYGQVLLFIARAMVAQGYWTLQPDDRALFPNQNGVAGADPDTDQQTRDHRMVVTYIHYAGTPPDIADPRAPFAVGRAGRTPAGWAEAAPRAWFARTLWQALNAYFGTDSPGFGGYLP